MVQTVVISGDIYSITESNPIVTGPGIESRLDFLNEDSLFFYSLNAEGGGSVGAAGGNGIVLVHGPASSQIRDRVQIYATALGGFGKTEGGDAEIRFFEINVWTPALLIFATASGGNSQVGGPIAPGSSSITIQDNNFFAPDTGSSFVLLLQLLTTLGTPSSTISITDNRFIGGAGADYWYISFSRDGETPIDSSWSANTFDLGAGDDIFTVVGNSTFVPEFITPPGVSRNRFDGGDGFDIFRFDDVDGITVDLFRDGFKNFEQVEGGAQPDSITGDGINNYLYGMGGNDYLNGGDGDDLLVGGTGDDEMDGGLGNDTASFIDSAAAVTVFLELFKSSGNGNDILRSLENVIGSNYNDDLNGNFETNRLEGRDGNDDLDGGYGDDVLSGGLGDDRLDGGVGSDWADYSDSENPLSLVGVTVDLSVPAQQNTVLAGLDTLTRIENVRGSRYNDLLTGDRDANWLYGLAGNDVLSGMGGDDILDGGDGNDLIDGGSGRDGMSGGLGDDIFLVDDSADIVNEYGGEGDDLVRSTADYALTGFVETLALLGSANLDGRGTDLANVLIGNGGANELDGAGGSDVMLGGSGDDTYFVESAGDAVVEVANQGFDLVVASISYTLGDNVEALLLADKANPFGLGNFIDNFSGGLFAFSNDISGTGNSLANVIIGNTGANTLVGLAGADLLSGGGGNDIFRDTVAGLNGDTITDFDVDDAIVVTDASLSGFSYSLTGNTLTFTGGSLTLQGSFAGYQIVARAAPGGGVQLTLLANVEDVRNDFNGDGRSDILWRNVDGQMSNWLGQANGGFTANNANAASVVPTAWKMVGTGDFNGDGRDDILWRHTDGTLSNWLGTAAGGYTPNDANAAVVVPTAWQVVGTGDFNGDGRDDILWRNTDGTLSDWLGNANGGFTPNDANAARFVPTDWKVAGTGDFNGDGRDDILWRKNDGTLSNWLGQANGGFTLNDAIALTVVPTAWSVVGTGDFNGDGRDDILWRNTNGTLSNWLGQANGGFIANDANAAVFVPTSWSVVATGDYNGDGRDDILWRNTDGTLSEWLGNANGGFTPNDANAATPVPTTWIVQTEPFLL